jgi:hypothetical protein
VEDKLGHCCAKVHDFTNFFNYRNNRQARLEKQDFTQAPSKVD